MSASLHNLPPSPLVFLVLLPAFSPRILPCTDSFSRSLVDYLSALPNRAFVSNTSNLLSGHTHLLVYWIWTSLALKQTLFAPILTKAITFQLLVWTFRVAIGPIPTRYSCRAARRSKLFFLLADIRALETRSWLFSYCGGIYL